MGNLSEHFDSKEFEDPNTGEFKVVPELIQSLEALRLLVGKPITVTSGFRSPSTNTEVGGAANSQHLLGRAADITWSGIDVTAAKRLAEMVGFTGIGVYAGHLHVDVRVIPPVEWSSSLPFDV